MFAAGIFIFTTTIASVSAQEFSGDAAFDAPAAAQAAAQTDPLLAAEQAQLFRAEGSGGAAGTPSTTGAVFRMVLTLALAAAAIYGVIYFIKRTSRRGAAQNPFLKVLASAQLSPNRNVHVVAAGSKAWLLGAADGGVNLICEIEDKDLLNAMFLEDSQRDAQSVAPGRVLDFKAMLRRLGMPVQGGTPGAENIRKRRERLKDM